jgi:Delta7-sterol 5-desaturase
MKNILQDLISNYGVIPTWLFSSFVVFLRYFVMAGGVYLFFYVLLKRRVKKLKIQSKSPENKQVLSEIRNSAFTALTFGLMAMFIHAARQFGYTKHYFEIAEYGWAYFIFTLFFVVFLHDAYFYWMHRLMHSPVLFRLLHRVHHQSFNPTPMASFAFHPLEALIEFGIVPLIVFVIPIHPYSLLFLSFWSLVWNILGHLGFELFPKGFTKHWFLGWINTSVHHNMHHQRVNHNYGLYFNIWDRWMNTNHPEYHKTFEKVKNNTHSLIEIQ